MTAHAGEPAKADQAAKGDPPARQGPYDFSELTRGVDYAARPNSGGWTETDVPRIVELAGRAARGDTTGQDEIVLRFNKPDLARTGREVLAYGLSYFGVVVDRRGPLAVNAWLAQLPSDPGWPALA